MRPVTSNVFSAPPARSSRPSAAPTPGTAASPRNATDQTAIETGEWTGQPGAADEVRGERHGEHAARSRRTTQVPRPVAAAVQDAARELDIEHVERSECDALRSEQQNEHS